MIEQPSRPPYFIRGRHRRSFFRCFRLAARGARNLWPAIGPFFFRKRPLTKRTANLPQRKSARYFSSSNFHNPKRPTAGPQIGAKPTRPRLSSFFHHEKKGVRSREKRLTLVRKKVCARDDTRRKQTLAMGERSLVHDKCALFRP